MRKNLFANPLDATITLGLLFLLYLVIPGLFEWSVFDATWFGETRADCTGDGACWIFIREKFVQFLVGFYPESEFYRLGWVAGLFGVFFGPLLIKKLPFRIFFLSISLLLFPVFSWLILEGTTLGLETVPTSKWGGLMLTLIIASVGIVAALPLGTILALGRRSQLPIIKTICILFIELWRAVPLITVLFMASVMLPLFLPEGVTFDKLIRALVGVTLFSAAYMAEVIRGGLQAIPRGQYEAAEALGLKYWQVMGKIIMPQALKKVIPGIVNTFIGLFKDTTLVLIIGMFDLLGIVQAAATDPEWLGYAVEGYVFAGVVFWIFCFAMSRFSQRLEAKLHTGH
jgi:general L-amino acid transport system permease protein